MTNDDAMALPPTGTIRARLYITNQGMGDLSPLAFADDSPSCATCRHWEPQDPLGSRAVFPSGDLGMWSDSGATRPDGIPRRGWGVCAMTRYGPEYAHPESLALSTDHEDYGAELVTRPDFGCVQWQPQPERH